jgi:ubiquinone/menaquinone biosynthesis C-methylase UbiE
MASAYVQSRAHVQAESDYAPPRMLVRVLEPEVMDTAREARDYDAMDHGGANARFCDDLLALGPIAGRVLDVGTGTARIPIELCRRALALTVVAIDLAEHMLALARAHVAEAGLGARIALERVDAKALPYDDGAFGATISNSIVHHIPAPEDALTESWRVTAAGGRLFVRDLARPEGEVALGRLVELYCGARPAGGPDAEASWARQRALFAASLRAALTVDEVAALVRPLGIPKNAIQLSSDRHWTLSWVKP